MDPQSQPVKADPSLEDVPRETLIELLRDKGREMQKLQKRLDKLQEKYVQTFKEQKQSIKDRDVLEKILTQLFSEEPYLLKVKPLGSSQYEYQELAELCQKREDEKQHTLNNLIEQTHKEKSELEERYKQMTEKQIQGMDQQSQTVIKQVKAQLHDLENNNTRLAKEIIELNDIIEMKNHELQQLKNIEEEYTNLKTQIMIQQLEAQTNLVSDSNDISARIKQSEGLNESLKLKNRMENVVGENRTLQQELSKARNEIESLKVLLEQTKQKVQSPIQKQSSFNSDQPLVLYTSNDYEFNPFEGEVQYKPVQKGQSTASVFVQTDFEMDQKVNIEIEEVETRNSVDNPSQEYLKNVLFKYFLFQETKNYKQAQMLKHALITILKISKEDRMILEEAKNKGSYWQSAKSYVTDNVFCYKQGLSDQYLQSGNMQSANQLAMQMNNSNFMK